MAEVQKEISYKYDFEMKLQEPDIVELIDASLKVTTSEVPNSFLFLENKSNSRSPNKIHSAMTQAINQQFQL